MKIFLAGASGVIGRLLLPLLVKAGHEVAGTTRRADRGDSYCNSGWASRDDGCAGSRSSLRRTGGGTT